MKSLLKYLKKYKWESFFGPFFKLVEASFELMVPIIVAQIIDTGIRNGDYRYIIGRCIILAALGIGGLFFSVTAQYFAAKAATGFAADLRLALFDKIQRLSYTEIDRAGTSSLITRMTSDVNTLQNGVNLVLRLFLRSPFIVFGAAALAFTVDARAAVTFVVVIPVLSAVVFGIMLLSIPLYKKVQSRLEGVLSLTRENLSGARVIRAFCSEESEKKAFTGENDALTALQLKVGRLSALMNPVTYIIVNAGIIALFFTGAVRVEDGVLSVGAVIALYNYMSQILVELIKLANLIITVTRSFAGASRIKSVLEAADYAAEELPEAAMRESSGKKYPGKVFFDSVSLRYHGSGEKSLEGVSFTAESGEQIGIIGGTGSGKTSLVSMIPGFYPAESGTVAVDGTDVRERDLAALRAKIAVVPQKAVLFKGTVRDNLLWGGAADDGELKKALRDAQALDFIQEKGGLSCPVEQGGRNFSGGQRQRLTVARALVRKPEILIFDDSSSALDFATDAAMRHAISCLPYKPTVFTVTQRASSVMHADKIIVLDDGKVAGIGTHESLLESCPVYREIYDSQFEKGGEAE